ncbi:MAG: Fe-Mn family superoxide dismutase [Pseudohongiellaceae bacterium]|jgi:Fe-Mn family superoxide dismutase
MVHTLPDLPFASDALAPIISAETLSFHHGKHHNAYVTNLNKLIDGTPNADLSLEELVKTTSGGVFNNAAQHFNHSFYWNCMAPNAGGDPTGAVADAINGSFGSFAAFREEFSKKAATLFGSGWVFLVQTADGKLAIEQHANAGCPLTGDSKPILTCDVWEHAYYVDFRNARPKYIEDFWKLVNWKFVASNLAG